MRVQELLELSTALVDFVHWIFLVRQAFERLRAMSFTHQVQVFHQTVMAFLSIMDKGCPWLDMMKECLQRFLGGCLSVPLDGTENMAGEIASYPYSDLVS